MVTETNIDKTNFSTMFSQIVFQGRETTLIHLKSPSQVLQDGLILKVPNIDTCQDSIIGVDSLVAPLIDRYEFLESRFMDCECYSNSVRWDAISLLNKVDLDSEDSNVTNQHLQRVFGIIQVHASLSRVFRLDLKNVLPNIAKQIKDGVSVRSSSEEKTEEILEHITKSLKQIEDELFLINDIQRVCTTYLMILKKFGSIHHRALLKIEEAGPHPGSEAKAYICVEGTVDGILEPFNPFEYSDLV
tara:strand:- start:8001 stop:8735 length:735 start_codon:yes stop_codon:yes gene_type:complete